jgi:hypothetical protein
MRAKQFDDKFDAGEDLSQSLDLAAATRVNQAPKRVNVDFPVWMVQALDEEARRLGVTRQSIIKVWISDRLSSLPRSPV